MSDTPLLQLPMLEASQAQKHVTHNEALLLLDAAIQLAVLSRAVAAPPAAPADGDRYLVAAGASGAWLSHDGDVALREAGSWRFLAPKTGWRLWDQSDSKLLVFDGSGWRDIQDIDVLNNMSLLGVNATADSGNRLAVSSAAVLFTHEGGDQRVKVNKHLAAGTGSLLFQTEYSGRAEMGLAGDDDFHVKVSADGGTWHEALTVDRSTGTVTFPNTVFDLSGSFPRTVFLNGQVTADGVTDNAAVIQAALNSLTPDGGTVQLPPGRILFGAELYVPDNVVLAGAGMDQTVLVEGTGLAFGSGISNANYSDADPGLGAPGIVIRDLTIDGELRQPPKWLSTASGTPITNPQADYLPGGCLAPAAQAVLNLTVSGGAVTNASVASGGAGYSFPPVVWITGDGIAAQVAVTISAGAVTAANVVSGGSGYTTASATVGGGGANPATALYAANRRNPGYAEMPISVSLVKTTRTRIENVRFFRTGGCAITDSGCDQLSVRNCRFDEGGQRDYVGSCVWSAGYGSNPLTEPYYRMSTDLTFEGNHVNGWQRSVATFGGVRPAFRNNVIDGWGESCFFALETAVAPAICGNRARNGSVTDIVCTFVEGANDTLVAGNTVEACDGRCVTLSGLGGGRIIDNSFAAPSTRVHTLPFGPYSERVGLAPGTAPVAGTQVNAINHAAISLSDVDPSPANAPQSLIIVNNRFSHDGGGSFAWLLDFSKGAANAIGDVIITSNDVSSAPGLGLYNAANAALCLDPTAQLIVENNTGVTGNDPVANDKLLAGDDLANAVANGHFERGDFGWTKGTGWLIESDAANARSGTWLARNASGAASSSALQSNGYSAANAGDVIQAAAWFKAAGTAGLTIRVQIVWHDGAKAVLSTSSGNAFTSDQAGYVQSLCSATAPAGTAYYRVRAICTKTAGTVWVDTIAAYRLRDAASVLSAATVGTGFLGGDITAAGKALLDDASTAAQRATLGLGTAAVENTSAFAAAVHSHSGLAPAGGAAGQILKKNSAADHDYSWGGDDGGEWYSAALAADVALAVSNTWYDGPGLSLPVGTWLVTGHITQIRSATTAEHVYARISDDTVHYASTQQYHASVAGTGLSLTMTAVVTVAATTTVKLQASTSAGTASTAMKAALTANASGNTATQITAIRMA